MKPSTSFGHSSPGGVNLTEEEGQAWRQDQEKGGEGQAKEEERQELSWFVNLWAVRDFGCIEVRPSD
jgi:hypothetical protein